MKTVKKSEEEQSSLSGVRFTRRCVCGNELQAAYNAELDIIFWNCFECFPIYPKSEPPTGRNSCERNSGLEAIETEG